MEIKSYSTYSQETKDTITERTIQKIERGIYKYLTESNTRRYKDFVHVDNNFFHRGIKTTPIMIHGLRKREDTAEQFDKMYLDIKDKNKAKSSLSVQSKVL